MKAFGYSYDSRMIPGRRSCCGVSVHDDHEPECPVCRYCGDLRPRGYAVTCGQSECQEANCAERTPKN